MDLGKRVGLAGVGLPVWNGVGKGNEGEGVCSPDELMADASGHGGGAGFL
jgi:hypothetical protein